MHLCCGRLRLVESSGGDLNASGASLIPLAMILRTSGRGHMISSRPRCCNLQPRKSVSCMFVQSGVELAATGTRLLQLPPPPGLLTSPHGAPPSSATAPATAVRSRPPSRRHLHPNTSLHVCCFLAGSVFADSGISDCCSNDVVLNEIHRNLA